MNTILQQIINAFKVDVTFLTLYHHIDMMILACSIYCSMIIIMTTHSQCGYNVLMIPYNAS